MAASLPFLVSLSVLLLSLSLSHASSFSNYGSLSSISHSLINRLVTLRAARGDISGADRARMLARTLDQGLDLGLYKSAFNFGWGYAKSFAWFDPMSYHAMAGMMSDMNELSGALIELSQIECNAARLVWVARNQKNVVRLLKSILTRLLTAFPRPGPLREILVALDKELIDGELTRDSIELLLGVDGLRGLVQFLKKTGIEYSSSFPKPDYSMGIWVLQNCSIYVSFGCI